MDGVARVHRVSVVASLAIVSVGCNQTAAIKPDLGEKEGVDVWFTEYCPTGAPSLDDTLLTTQKELLGAELLALLGAAAVDFIIDEVGDALSEAAEKDLKGIGISGKSPGYLFKAPGEDAAECIRRVAREVVIKKQVEKQFTKRVADALTGRQMEELIAAVGIGDQPASGTLDKESLNGTSFGTIRSWALRNSSEIRKGVRKAEQDPTEGVRKNCPKTSAPYTLPTCAVVALSNSPPEAWCDAAGPTAFEDAVGKTCDSLRDLTMPTGTVPRQGRADPRFYAEIELYPSPDRSALIPAYRALWYPKPLHPKEPKFKEGKKRDVSVSISGTLPNGEAALGTVYLQLKNFIPRSGFLSRSEAYNPTEIKGDLTKFGDTAPTLWVAVAPPPKKLPDDLAAGTWYRPINITAEIREIGDPVAFLQNISKAFNDNKDKISESIQKQVIPTKREEAEKAKEVEELENDAALQAAIASVYEKLALLDQECASTRNGEYIENPTTDEERQKNRRLEIEVQQQWSAARAAVQKVRKIELEQGIDIPSEFPYPVQGDFVDVKTACGL